MLGNSADSGSSVGDDESQSDGSEYDMEAAIQVCTILLSLDGLHISSIFQEGPPFV